MKLVGVISVYRHRNPAIHRQANRAADRNFAAQAVIAIENTRLFNELRQRTDDLTESLEQQTASGEILASISGSMADTKPVFEAIVRNLKRLFGTRLSMVQICTKTAWFISRPPARRKNTTLFRSPSPARWTIRPAPAAPCWRKRWCNLRRSSAIRMRRPACRQFAKAIGLQCDDLRPDVARRQGDRRHRRRARGGEAVHRKAGRPHQDLRRAGCHRHREHAAVQRAAPAHRRSHRGAGAADGDRRRAERHEPLQIRPHADPAKRGRHRGAPLPRRPGSDLPAGRRALSLRRRLQPGCPNISKSSAPTRSRPDRAPRSGGRR